MKDRVVRQVTALSAHGPQPLANTLSYAGDSGLLGPDSVSWKVIGDAAAFVGGIRALLVQAAHPEVVAWGGTALPVPQRPIGTTLSHIGLRHRDHLRRHARVSVLPEASGVEIGVLR